MSFESYIQQIKDIGKKARERDVLSPFRAASNQMALGRTSELEALNRQQIEAEQQAMAQQQDRGFETLGGSPAAERRFNEAVAAGGQRYNQAASQLGIQQGQAEQARDARADAFGLQAAQAGIAHQERIAERQFRQQQAQFDREVRREEARLAREHATEGQKRQFRVQVELHYSQMKQRHREMLASIRRTQIENPLYGGVRMTSSVVSPGGSGNSNVHPSSRYATWT